MTGESKPSEVVESSCGGPSLNNSHYYKTQKLALKSRKQSQDSEPFMSVNHTRTADQPGEDRHGADVAAQSTFVSEAAKHSSNRQKLYRQVRDSSKEQKRRLNESPNQKELLQEIQGVVDDVKERISEYEEIKSSFADPEVNIPYSIQNMSGKSPHERRGSSSEHSTPK